MIHRLVIMGDLQLICTAPLALQALSISARGEWFVALDVRRWNLEVCQTLCSQQRDGEQHCIGKHCCRNVWTDVEMDIEVLY
jgi:hypothetical protein